MEEDIQGRQPSMEGDLLWRRNFDGRHLSMEDDLQWKATFIGRQGKGKLKVDFVSPATTRTRATFLAKNIKHTEEP